jgi:organic radical activating enzyme
MFREVLSKNWRVDLQEVMMCVEQASDEAVEVYVERQMAYARMLGWEITKIRVKVLFLFSLVEGTKKKVWQKFEDKDILENVTYNQLKDYAKRVHQVQRVRKELEKQEMMVWVLSCEDTREGL